MCEWRFSCKFLADSLYQEAFGEAFYNGIQAPVRPSKNHTVKDKDLHWLDSVLSLARIP